MALTDCLKKTMYSWPDGRSGSSSILEVGRDHDLEAEVRKTEAFFRRLADHQYTMLNIEYVGDSPLRFRIPHSKDVQRLIGLPTSLEVHPPEDGKILSVLANPAFYEEIDYNKGAEHDKAHYSMYRLQLEHAVQKPGRRHVSLIALPSLDGTRPEFNRIAVSLQQTGKTPKTRYAQYTPTLNTP